MLRIGDAERTAALNALGEHMAAGRLDLAEYESRSGVVAAARTTADLQGLFDDLPAPHPPIAGLQPRPAAAVPPPAPGQRTRGQAIAAGVAGSAGVIAVIAFFLLHNVWDQAWLVFLLIPVVAGIAGSIANQGRRELPPGSRR